MSLENRLESLEKAVRDLISTLENKPPADQQPLPFPQESQPADRQKDRQQEEQEEQEEQKDKTVSLQDLITVATQLVGKGKRAEIKDLLHEHNVEKITELHEEDYPEFFKQLQRLIDKTRGDEDDSA